jgi:hypothetical protein
VVDPDPDDTLPARPMMSDASSDFLDLAIRSGRQAAASFEHFRELLRRIPR